MTEINSLLLLTLGELLLVSSMVAILLLVSIALKKRRDRKAAATLISRIKEDNERRQEETKALLMGYGIEGAALEELLVRVNREEMRFYQTLINLYLKRDAGELEVLHLAFEGATEPYRNLGISAAGQLEADVGSADTTREIERLKDENKRLSDELRITMDTMGRMLNEYSSMFAGGDGGDLDKEKIADMFRSDGDGGDEGTEDVPETAPAGPVAEDLLSEPAIDEIKEDESDQPAEELFAADEMTADAAGVDQLMQATDEEGLEPTRMIGEDGLAEEDILPESSVDEMEDLISLDDDLDLESPPAAIAK